MSYDCQRSFVTWSRICVGRPSYTWGTQKQYEAPTTKRAISTGSRSAPSPSHPLPCPPTLFPHPPIPLPTPACGMILITTQFIQRFSRYGRDQLIELCLCVPALGHRFTFAD